MKNHIYIILVVLLAGCVREPVQPPDNSPVTQSPNAAYILCEGLWGMDNSSLSRYDFENGTVVNSFFEKANPGYRLGDLANNIVLYGDTVYIAVTSAMTIETFRASTGKSVGRLKFDGRHAPRRICIINDTIGFVSDLYSNSVIEFNPKTLVKTDEIKVGPAPEGLATLSNYLFVANSGYGDYLADAPKAGTVSVIDIRTKQVIKEIYSGPNTIDLVVNSKTNKLYSAYRNLPSKKDSLGGIVEFDIFTLQETRRWLTNVYGLALSLTGDSLFFLDKNGVSIINLRQPNFVLTQFILNQNDKEFWYSLAVNPADNTLWLGNARNYQINGEILIFDISNPVSASKRFTVGINPNSIIFFKKN